jgi:alpha-tubulin suppressor-like RCC1 family protein
MTMKTAVVAIAATFLLWPTARATAGTLAAGPEHALVLTPDGRVLSWGRATSGRLGNGAVAGLFSPAGIPALTDVVAVAAGRAHSVALRRDGTVWTWGDNSYGQLGTDRESTASPIQVPGLRGISAIAAGDDHTLVWAIDGSVLAWGSNSFGQLGTGDRTDSAVPVRVAGLGPVLRIAAGARHSVAVLLDGSVWSWGDNTSRQIEDTDENSVPRPLRIAGLPPSLEIAAGDAHTLALEKTGRVWSWGDGRAEPMEIVGLPPVVAVAAGGGHSLALSQDGFVWVWGANDFGELGNDSQQAAIVPARLSRPVGVTDIAAGKTYSLARTRDGSLWGWGDSRHGQLGDTLTEPNLTPQSISLSPNAPPTPTVATPTFSPAAGNYAADQNVTISCATSGASIYYTTNGTDPTQSSTLYSGPVLVDRSLTLKARAFKAGSNPSAVATGIYTLKPAAPAFAPAPGTYPSPQSVTVSSTTAGATIRVTTDLTDPNSSSPLYTGPMTVARPMTLKARALKTGWTDSDVTTAAYTVTTAATGAGLAAGQYHSAVLKPDGTVWSWGNGNNGQIGNGGTANAFPPVPSSITAVKAIAAGSLHTLALKTDGTVWGWGYNGYGQLGNGNTTQQNSPVRAGTLTGIVAIAAGENFSVAIDSAGGVYTWGRNDVGQLGDGTTATFKSSPVKLKSFAANLIAAGTAHVLARKTDNTLWAWGWNIAGQVGDNTTTNRNKPVAVTGISGVTVIGAGDDHSLAAKGDGTTWSWGANWSGQLGDGTSGVGRRIPGQVPGLAGIVQVAAGGPHSFAVSNDGHLWTWGSNVNGQVGNGASSERELSPVALGLFPLARVDGGVAHSIALTDDGTVWSWGDDRTGFQSRIPVAISAPNFLFKAAPATFNPPGPGGNDTFNVTLSTTTPGAPPIYYTTDGSDPLEGGPSVPNNGTVFVDRSFTLRARVFKTGYAPSDISQTVYVLTPRNPSFSPSGGTVFAPTTITFFCTVETSSLYTVYYTTLNRDPIAGTDPSGPCNNPSSLVVNSNVTVRAMVTRAGWANSGVAIATYSVKVGTPTFTPPAGSYSSAQTVRLNTVTPGALIHYTTDGTQPTQSSPSVASNGTVSVGGSLVLKVRAYLPGWPASDLGWAVYTLTLGAAATPTMNPPAGTYIAEQRVSLATATTGAVIRYTLDGSDPTAFSLIYESPLTVANTTTVKAKAFKVDRTASTTATATYTINLSTAAKPRLSPAGGRFTTQRTVTFTCDTPGALLHYTTNGVNPTSADPSPPPGGILVDRTQTVKVLATASGLPDSPVAQEAYVITGAVAAGSLYTVALKADGTVWSWGANARGQIGDGTQNQRLVPTQAVGLSGVVAISTHLEHTLALKSDGTVWAWGNNANGQLGDNTTTDRSQATLVLMPNLGGAVVVAISAGANHSVALTSNGRVYYWGDDGFNSQRLTPGQLAAFTGGVTQISTGYSSSMALKTDGATSGAVWVWGQLGGCGCSDPTRTRGRSAPVIDLTGATAVYEGGAGVGAGSDYFLAQRADGLWGWGSNGWGQLGFDMPSQSSAQYEMAPRILFNLGPLSTAAAGGLHTLAVDTAGRVWAWGWPEYGVTAAANVFDAHIVPGIANTIGVAAGMSQSAAAKADGTVWTWGSNLGGALANGTPLDFATATPAPVINFSVVANGSLTGDPDGDGLSTQDEYLFGTDPYSADTNGDGISDGVAATAGISATKLDMDADGVTNAVEIARGTDPFRGDTDDDGVSDGPDCFPLDSSRSVCPPPVPGDTTPPLITLQEPTNAVLISIVPPPQ